jgi:hypothetical protein
MNRKQVRLADGRYIKQITPDLFYLYDEFGNKLAELPAEHVSDENLCTDNKPESDPAD